MTKLLPLLTICFIFIAIKISSTDVRFSDTNIYFYLAHELSSGKLLYKDLFFANFPLFGYISLAYYFLVGKNIHLFYISSIIEVVIITSLIYYIVSKKTKDYLVTLTSSLLYIFSFLVLSTSDHQTGVFTASLFAILAFLFKEKKQFFISGFLIAASLFTKAYFAPIVIAFFLDILIQKRYRNLLKIFLGFILASTTIIVPFLFFAPTQFIKDIFGFSLTRPQGLSKVDIAWFFVTKDLAFFILFIFNLLNFKRNKLFALVSIFSIVFFLGYADVYYLYLNFLSPFLALSFYEFNSFLAKKYNLQKLILPSIIFILLIINIINYLSSYKDLQKAENLNSIINAIKKEKPEFLFGVHDITPALLYLTDTKPLDNIFDAYEYLFTRGLVDKDKVSRDATNTKTIVIAYGAFYPNLNIVQDITDRIFNNDLIYKKCKLLDRFPINVEGYVNRLNLFRCY